MLSSLFTFACLIINLGQEEIFTMIIKTFVSLRVICTIDNLFVNSISNEMKENLTKVNKMQILKMGQD